MVSQNSAVSQLWLSHVRPAARQKAYHARPEDHLVAWRQWPSQIHTKIAGSHFRLYKPGKVQFELSPTPLSASYSNWFGVWRNTTMLLFRIRCILCSVSLMYVCLLVIKFIFCRAVVLQRRRWAVHICHPSRGGSRRRSFWSIMAVTCGRMRFLILPQLNAEWRRMHMVHSSGTSGIDVYVQKRPRTALCIWCVHISCYISESGFGLTFFFFRVTSPPSFPNGRKLHEPELGGNWHGSRLFTIILGYSTIQFSLVFHSIDIASRRYRGVLDVRSCIHSLW